MLVIALFGLMLIITLMRVALPVGAQVEGRVVREFRLSFRDRLRLQRTNVYLIGTALLIGGLAGWLPVFVELVVVLGVFAILAIPARYIVTDQGIALNHVVFRPWKEFRCIEDAGRALCLRGIPGYRDFYLIVGPSRRTEVRRVAADAIARVQRATVSRKGVRSVMTSTTAATHP
jgi:hypothetical protein